jgi:DNA-binding response OmpR family regulator
MTVGASAPEDDPVLLLDVSGRCLRGIVMSPLLTGELKLLQYLGSKPRVWHSARLLSKRVYLREDPGAIQLVWKYVSTLRSKVANAQLELLETCRRRGYRCSMSIRVIGIE